MSMVLDVLAGFLAAIQVEVSALDDLSVLLMLAFLFLLNFLSVFDLTF
jgi:hypothetical protein